MTTSATTISEIAPDIFRLCTYIEPADLTFCQFVVRDDEPLLFHTGMRALFPAVRDALAKILDPASLRWLTFSHFEADESGALNDWLAIAPRAQAAASFLACVLDVEDFAVRPPRALADNESFSTGKRRFRFIQTPHVPHAWEAGLLLEETTGTLLSSDLLFQRGNPPAVDGDDVLERCRDTIVEEEAGPFAFSFPYTARTAPTLERLAQLEPRTLAAMHGSTFQGDGAGMLRRWAAMLAEVNQTYWVPESEQPAVH